MASARQGLKRLAGTIGFLSVAVLLNALVCVYPAAAQCGPAAGSGNTACGTNALQANTTGVNNTATGENALTSNTGGFNNTANGWEALLHNTTGIENTATGEFALAANIVGSRNTADGKAALFNNTGSFNTATGYKALFGQAGNSSGTDNTASGYQALFGNTSGSGNTASGIDALFGNTSGSGNTAIGGSALANNAGGSDNTATGGGALDSNIAGSGNTASGAGALANNTGSNNTAVGSDAGLNITTGSNNIEIGNAGSASDSNVIRIGTAGTQRKVFVAGINNSAVTGTTVLVTSGGRLGIAPSSARFKRNIRPMNNRSEALMQLRPVTFIYKNDPSNTRQYGLVAEQVREVYPELVTYDDQGKLQSVRYEQLIPMLLNELQKQTAKAAAQQHEIDALKQKDASINTLSERLATLEQQMRTANSARFDSLAKK